MQNKVTISSIEFINAIYTESCRQYWNCASEKIVPLYGGKTEQAIERHTPRGIICSWEIKSCLSREYLLYLYWENLPLSEWWWHAKPLKCNLTGTVMNSALICHPSFNFYSMHRAFNDTGNVNRLISITYHVIIANLLTWQRKHERF